MFTLSFALGIAVPALIVLRDLTRLTGEPLARAVLTFFLGCVVAAGAFGAATVSPRIFLVQALPALCALAAIWRL